MAQPNTEATRIENPISSTNQNQMGDDIIISGDESGEGADADGDEEMEQEQGDEEEDSQ